MNKCYYCEREVSLNGPLRPTQDHIIPKSRGGNNLKINKVLSCHVCNGVKADRIPEAFSLLIEGIISNGCSRNPLRCKKEVVQTILNNNNNLIKKISSYRIDLLKKNQPFDNKKKEVDISLLLKENTQKSKKIKNPKFEPKAIIQFWSNHQWTQEQFENHFKGQQHFHYL